MDTAQHRLVIFLLMIPLNLEALDYGQPTQRYKFQDGILIMRQVLSGCDEPDACFKFNVLFMRQLQIARTDGTVIVCKEPLNAFLEGLLA